MSSHQLLALIPRWRSLRRLRTEPNPFVLLGTITREETHARMLTWLLDPAGSHGLGTSIINTLSRECGFDSNWTSDARVLREHRIDAASRTDVLVTDSAAHLAWIIELKTLTVDHHDQLTRYREWCERHPVLDGRKPRLTYMTPRGEVCEVESEREHWGAVSYSSLLSALDSATIAPGSTPAHRTIDDYRRALRRFLVNTGEVRALCRQIQRDWSNELDSVRITLHQDVEAIARNVRTFATQAGWQTRADKTWELSPIQWTEQQNASGGRLKLRFEVVAPYSDGIQLKLLATSTEPAFNAWLNNIGCLSIGLGAAYGVANYWAFASGTEVVRALDDDKLTNLMAQKWETFAPAIGKVSAALAARSAV